MHASKQVYIYLLRWRVLKPVSLHPCRSTHLRAGVTLLSTRGAGRVCPEETVNSISCHQPRVECDCLAPLERPHSRFRWKKKHQGKNPLKQEPMHKTLPLFCTYFPLSIMSLLLLGTKTGIPSYPPLSVVLAGIAPYDCPLV